MIPAAPWWLAAFAALWAITGAAAPVVRGAIERAPPAPAGAERPPAPPFALPAGPPRLVLIVDDLGEDLDAARRVLALPAAVACAILPGTRHGAALARAARQTGHEVLLHLPMTARGGAYPGPLALTTGMSAGRLEATLDAALAAVPGAAGVNNHMGSALTAQPAPMRVLMRALRARSLYFIDSRTSADTVAAVEGRIAGVPVLERRVFLDDEHTPAAIEAQWRRALDLARAERLAVVIGHPHAETLALLEARLPELSGLGVTLVAPGALLKTLPSSRRTD